MEIKRRTLWKGAGAAALAGSVLNAAPARAEPTGTVSLRWLGTNAWEFTTSEATVLIDPWISRFRTGTYKEGEFDPETKIEVYPEAIDEHVGGADCVLVTHGHYDHICDVPYVARKTGATVIGNESHLNFLRAMDAPEEQLAEVAGGELYKFDGFTVEVFRSSHSAGRTHKTIAFGGSWPGSVPPRPKRINELLEGGSLTYLLDFGGVSFFNAGSANFHHREIEGIRPTAVFVQPGGSHTPDYIERLLECTGYPPYVIATHWDDFDEPLTEPAVEGIRGGVARMRERVEAASPQSEFILIDHLESHDF